MKKLTLIMMMMFISITITHTVSAQETPPPPQPPYSLDFPDSTYEMTQEQVIGGVAVRFWKNISVDEAMFADIATLQWNNELGAGYVQIEYPSAIHPLTGTDITGDGFVDVIIETYSGGAHCCSSVQIFSVLPNDLIQIYQHPQSNCGINFSDVNSDGVYEIVTCDDTFAYLFCPYVSSYFPMVILGYDSTLQTYIPLTSEYVIAMTEFNERLKMNLNTVQNATPSGFSEWDNSTKCQVLPIVLDYLYSGQTDLAWQTFDTYYTEADADDFRAQTEAIVNGSVLYKVAIPPVSDTLQTPLLLDRQLVVGDYAARIWRSGANLAIYNAYDTIGQVIRTSDNATITEINNVVDFPMNAATDVNGNGILDIIINTFTGGAHCCSSTIVYDLGETPVEILRTRESNYGGWFEDIDGNGTDEFITADDVFAYAFCPYAFSPAVQVILSYDNAVGRYVVMNTAYSEYYADALTDIITDATTAPDGAFGEWDGTNKCAVLPVVLNYLYSGQYDMAWTEFYRLYRGADADTFRADIEAIINSSMYYVP